VNTPQTNSTWKRVWDSPHVTQIDQEDVGICHDEFCISPLFQIVEIEVKEFPNR
jgi:hypothetical protein